MLSIGDEIPNIELPNQNNESVCLADYRGKKIVLFAFPMAGTPDCTNQACTYRDMKELFAEYDTEVFGITGNPVPVLSKWHKHHGFNYDLLSDNHNRLLDELGAWGQPVFAGIELPLAVRSYWGIDEAGIIQQAEVGTDPEESVHESLTFIRESVLTESQH